MVDHIFNQMLIVGTQWRRTGAIEYEQQFEALLNELQRVTGSTQDQAIQMLYDKWGVVEEEVA